MFACIRCLCLLVCVVLAVVHAYVYKFYRWLVHVGPPLAYLLLSPFIFPLGGCCLRCRWQVLSILHNCVFRCAWPCCRHLLSTWCLPLSGCSLSRAATFQYFLRAHRRLLALDRMITCVFSYVCMHSACMVALFVYALSLLCLPVPLTLLPVLGFLICPACV